MTEFITKDSGVRQNFDSGMRRDTEDGKARFDLMFPKDVPYDEQMLTRLAGLLARGAEKYDARNWELARGQAELDRYYSSATRHFAQWLTGETDEDHAAAVLFNIIAGETVKYKMRKDAEEDRKSLTSEEAVHAAKRAVENPLLLPPETHGLHATHGLEHA